jgi:hypothetical protein
MPKQLLCLWMDRPSCHVLASVIYVFLVFLLTLHCKLHPNLTLNYPVFHPPTAFPIIRWLHGDSFSAHLSELELYTPVAFRSLLLSITNSDLSSIPGPFGEMSKAMPKSCLLSPTWKGTYFQAYKHTSIHARAHICTHTHRVGKAKGKEGRNNIFKEQCLACRQHSYVLNQKLLLKFVSYGNTSVTQLTLNS